MHATTFNARLEALKARHTALESQIAVALKSRSMDSAHVQTLKRLKLVIKEEMEGIRRAS